MKTIDWKLVRLKPYQSDIFKTLDEWFDRRSNPFMQEHYDLGTIYHKGQVNRFTQADYRESKHLPQDSASVNWRRIMAKRLFGLRRAISMRTSQLDRYCKAHFPLKHTCFNHFWRLRNCRPYGGQWEANLGWSLHPRNPTGHPCMSRYCPWCYLRRFDCYLTCLQAPRGSRVWYPLRLKLRPQGFPKLVNVTSFERSFDAPTDRTKELMLEPDLRSEGERFLSEPCIPHVVRAQKLFEGIRSGPFDPDTVSFTVPLYNETLSEGLYRPVVGIRVGFVHTDPVNAQAEKYVAGLSHYRNVTIGDALRWVYPFPLNWLRTDAFPEVKTRLMVPFHGVNYHGIVKAPLSRIRDANPYREFCSTGSNQGT